MSRHTFHGFREDMGSRGQHGVETPGDEGVASGSALQHLWAECTLELGRQAGSYVQAGGQ